MRRGTITQLDTWRATGAIAVVTALTSAAPVVAQGVGQPDAYLTDAIRIEVSTQDQTACATRTIWAFGLDRAPEGFGGMSPAAAMGYGPACAIIDRDVGASVPSYTEARMR